MWPKLRILGHIWLFCFVKIIIFWYPYIGEPMRHFFCVEHIEHIQVPRGQKCPFVPQNVDIWRLIFFCFGTLFFFNRALCILLRKILKLWFFAISFRKISVYATVFSFFQLFSTTVLWGEHDDDDDGRHCWCMFYANMRPINSIGPTNAMAQPFPNGSQCSAWVTVCKSTQNLKIWAGYTLYNVVIVHRERHLPHRNQNTPMSKLHYQMPFLRELEDLVNVADVQKSFDQYFSAASELRSIIFPF